MNLDTLLTYPGNNQTQNKSGTNLLLLTGIASTTGTTLISASIRFEAVENGAAIAANTQSAPINGSFSLSKGLNLKSAGKALYEANDIHKVFIKNLLDFSDDYSRSVAKKQFWYLDSDATTETDGNARNTGMWARARLLHADETEGLNFEGSCGPERKTGASRPWRQTPSHC